MIDQEVARLSVLARDAAATVADVPSGVAYAIRHATDGRADPWLLIGVLIEGTAQAVATVIPPERRDACARAALRLLADRLGISGS